tara:strand:- start:156 stop:1541 length:1386 start_codon:yes stop_codon:yes gene_type:complete
MNKTEIVGRLHLMSNKKYGYNKRNIQYFLFTSLDETNKNKYLVATKIKRKIKDDIYVTVNPVTTEKMKFQKYQFAHLNRVIGIDHFEMLFYKYHLCIKKYKTRYITDDVVDAERVDVSSFYSFSIDPPGSRDIDDALFIWKDYIYIHIADPTSYVESNDLLRYSTIYGKRVINMYNDEIGYNTCSLLKGTKRNAITFIYDSKKKCIIDDFPSIVQLNENMTYNDRNDNIDLLIKMMNCNDTHKIIETLMVSVNIYTGDILSNIGQGIFRNYEMTETENIPILDNDLNKFLKIIKSNCAKYSLIPKSHEFLKLDNYCHFTSPLRRYTDTLNHLLWKKFKYGLNIDLPIINSDLIDNINIFEQKLRKMSRDINRFEISDQIGDDIVIKYGYIIGIDDNNSVVYFKEYGIIINVDIIPPELLILSKLDTSENKLNNKLNKLNKLYDKVAYKLFNCRGRLHVAIC